MVAHLARIWEIACTKHAPICLQASHLSRLKQLKYPVLGPQNQHSRSAGCVLFRNHCCICCRKSATAAFVAESLQLVSNQTTTSEPTKLVTKLKCSICSLEHPKFTTKKWPSHEGYTIHVAPWEHQDIIHVMFSRGLAIQILKNSKRNRRQQ